MTRYHHWLMSQAWLELMLKFGKSHRQASMSSWMQLRRRRLLKSTLLMDLCQFRATLQKLSLNLSLSWLHKKSQIHQLLVRMCPFQALILHLSHSNHLSLSHCPCGSQSQSPRRTSTVLMQSSKKVSQTWAHLERAAEQTYAADSWGSESLFLIDQLQSTHNVVFLHYF